MPSQASVAFVQQLYQNDLYRSGSTGEIDAWATYIDSGVLTPDDVATDIANSPEAKTEAPIVGLYQTLLQRQPDAAEVQHWVSAYQGGMSLDAITSAFTHSAEYQALHPLDQSTAFVQALYQNILQRSGSDAEIAAWANAISSGAITPQQAETDIATSPEVVNYVLPVERLYQAVYGVPPDATTLSQDVNAIRNGESLSALATSFVQSDSIQREIATEWLPGTFVNAVYHSILGRAPDAAGYNNWVDYLDANGNTLTAKGQVILGLANSAEYIASTTPNFETTLGQLVNPNDYFSSGVDAFSTLGSLGLGFGFTEFPVFHTNLVITIADPQVITLPTATTASSGGIWLRDPSAPYSGPETIAVTAKSYAGLNAANPASGTFTSGYDQISNFDANGRTDQIALTTNYAAALVNGSPNAGVLSTVATGGIDVSGGSVATGYFIPDGVFFVTHTGAVDLTNLSSIGAAIGSIKTSPAPTDKFVVILDDGSSASRSTEFGVYEVTAGEPSGHTLGAGANAVDTVKLLELVQAPGGFSMANYTAPVTGVDAPSGGPSVNLNVTANQTFTTGQLPIVTTANFIVAPGASVTLGNGTTGSAGDFGLDPLQTVTVSGGSATSTFSVNDSKGVFGDADFSTFDASAFAGSVQLTLVDSLNGPRFYYAGQGSANSLFEIMDGNAPTSGGDGAPTVVGFQTVTIEGGGIDARGFSGVQTLNWVGGGSFDIVGLPAGVTIGIGDPTGRSGGSYLSIDDGNYPDAYSLPSVTFDLNGGNPEGLSIRVSTPNLVFDAPTSGPAVGQNFNLSVIDDNIGPVAMTFDGGVAGQEIRVSGLPTNAAALDASGLAANLAMTSSARATEAQAMTITGGVGTNSIELANAGDVLNGGLSGHNTLVVNAATGNGSITIDLSAQAGHSEVTAFDGASMPPTVTNFANVDLAGLTGPNGANVIASPYGSTIGTSRYGDMITLSATSAAVNTIELDVDGSTYLAITSPSASGTFTHYTSVANFETAGRADAMSFYTSSLSFAFNNLGFGFVTMVLSWTDFGTTVAAVGSGTIVTTSNQNLFYIDNAAADLTSLASVDTAIGAVQTSATNASPFFVILNDATASHFGVYEVTANEATSARLGANPSDMIKLLAIFDHGFTTASYAQTAIFDPSPGTPINFAKAPNESWVGGSGAASQINVAAATSVGDALNIAAVQGAAENGGQLAAQTGMLDWFLYGGNTYIVEAINNGSAPAAHAALGAGDAVVELAGLVNLANVTFSNHILTI